MRKLISLETHFKFAYFPKSIKKHKLLMIIEKRFIFFSDSKQALYFSKIIEETYN